MKKLFILLILISLLSCDFEIMKSHYATYKDAVKDGAIERGWIPKYFPSCIYDIYEKHDLDSNDVWMIFKFNKKDYNKLIKDWKQIKDINDSEEKFEFKREYQNIINSELHYYQYHPKELLAIDLKNRIAYYYSDN